MGKSAYDSLASLLLYTFDLPLFFFISGYLAYKSGSNIKIVFHDIRKKFIYLVIPAISFRTVLNLIEHKSILSPFWMGFGKYWFTITLFECFLIYFILLLLVKKDNWRIIILTILSIISILLLGVYNELDPKILDTNHFLKYFYFFVIGLFAKRLDDKYRKLLNSDLFKFIIIVIVYLPYRPSRTL